MTMAIILLHMFWGVVFFDACEKRCWWAVGLVVIVHLLVSCLVSPQRVKAATFLCRAVVSFFSFLQDSNRKFFLLFCRPSRIQITLPLWFLPMWSCLGWGSGRFIPPVGPWETWNSASRAKIRTSCCPTTGQDNGVLSWGPGLLQVFFTSRVSLEESGWTTVCISTVIRVQRGCFQPSPGRSSFLLSFVGLHFEMQLTVFGEENHESPACFCCFSQKNQTSSLIFVSLYYLWVRGQPLESGKTFPHSKCLLPLKRLSIVFFNNLLDSR